ncbi:MAG TPA: histidine phosphatase family protein [Candidatus Thermoplasmatota archaeon]|nr:histidine phosphatase family protein [Candidatus Thermoplasmatota archaeon]
MRLFVIRHGQTDANAAGIIQGSLIDLPLNARGRAEAAALARAFPRGSLDLILTSTLKRARETAEAIAVSTGAPVSVHPELVEYDWGDYLGKPNEGAIHASMVGFVDRWKKGEIDVGPPGGETPRQVAGRVRRVLGPALEAFAARRPDGRVAVVAHGRLNKILLADLVHGDLARQEDFGQGNTSVTVLEGHPAPARGSWKLVASNGLAHLDGIKGDSVESE